MVYEPISLFILTGKGKNKSFAPKLSLNFLKNCTLNTLEVTILKYPQLKYFLINQCFNRNYIMGFIQLTTVFLLSSTV